ncbi:MAG: hypothetical protein K2I70_00615, partial [Bacilli bacterium]|nr:hypothetical protein [Bacilli bacterium]
MKNKVLIIIVGIISTFFFLYLAFNTNKCIKEYDYNFNIVISNLIDEIKEEYPNIDTNEIVKMLNKEKLEEKAILKEYGIDIKSESISINGQNIINKMLISNSII